MTPELTAASLILTVISSAVAVAVWLAAKITRLETKVDYVVERVEALEDSRPRAAQKRKCR